jgi:hemerythrin-like domain-containing protein
MRVPGLRVPRDRASVRVVTDIQLPRPTEGDVVDLILADHRLFEDLLHQLRDITCDRVAVRKALADVVAAHAEAEEQYVYPTLVRKKAVDEEDAEHGTHEHLEGNEKLLALLEVSDVESEDFGDAVEELTKALAHHLDEEEREILNPARTDVSDDVKRDLGAKFAAERNRQLDAGAGDPDNLRKLIEKERQRLSEG